MNIDFQLTHKGGTLSLGLAQIIMAHNFLVMIYGPLIMEYAVCSIQYVLNELSLTFFTGWVTDNSCQVNNDVVLFDKCLVSWSVQDITFDNSQVWMMKNSEK